MKRDLLKRLYERGHISESAFQKYSQGGMVGRTPVVPAFIDQAIATSGVRPQTSAPVMSDVEQRALQRRREFMDPRFAGTADMTPTSILASPPGAQPQMNAEANQSNEYRLADASVPSDFTFDKRQEPQMPMAQMPDPFTGQSGAISNLSSTIAQAGAEQQKLMKQASEMQLQAANDMAQEQAALEERLRTQQDKVEQALADYRDMDPRSYVKSLYANQDTASKVMAGVALLFGAVGAANDGVNRVAQMMERNLERDIQMAERNKDALGQFAQGQRSIYSDLRAAGLDRQQARNKMLELNLNHVSQLVNAQAARIGTAEAMARAEGMQSQIAERKAALQADLNQRMLLQAASSGQKVDRQSAMMLPKEMRETYVPALKSFATTKEGAAKVNEVAAGTIQAIDGIKEIRGLGRKGSSLSITDRRKVEAVRTELVGALRLPYLGPGVITAEEAERLMKIIPSPLEFTTIGGQERLEFLSKRLQRALDSTAKAYGVQSSARGDYESAYGRR